MARQVIDTTTNNGTYIGDPAKTAFEKTNANFVEIYGWAGTGALAKLVGGNTFTGNQVFNSGNITCASSIVSNANGISSFGAGCGYSLNDRVDFAQTWATFVNGNEWNLWNNTSGSVMRSSRAGAISALSFNPTSTSDVKDYIEGYSGDACGALDRLVVITYQYRPEYADMGSKAFIGLLQENVKHVVPGAANDSEIREVEIENGDIIEVSIPGNIDITQLLALSVRSHQQKSKRIRDLEAKVSSLVDRMAAAGI